MAAITRKSIIGQLPPPGWRSDFDDKRNGIIPVQAVRDILDSFVSKVEDSPALTTEPKMWDAPQAFTTITATSAGFGFVECGGFRYTGPMVPMTPCNGAQVTAVWDATAAEVLDNMRQRINELEAKLANVGL